MVHTENFIAQVAKCLVPRPPPFFPFSPAFSIIHGSERVAKNGGAGKKVSEIHADYLPLQMFSLDRNGVPN